MRRFLAYILMMLTMLSAIIFNTQAVMENRTDAMEYGAGTELVYSLTKRDATKYDLTKDTDMQENGTEDLTAIDIESEVMERLDIAGVRNAEVNIVQGDEDQVGYQLRVSLSPLSDTELNNVKEIIGITGSLSIATIGDTAIYYYSADEFFDTTQDNIAEITYNGTTPYPTLHVKDTESYDQLKKDAEEASSNKASEAHRYYADDTSSDSSDEESDDSTTVYLWTNRTTDDTYDKAFGTHDTVIQEAVKDKVIAKIDLNNWSEDSLALQITSDIDGNAWTISTARAFVNMLNCDDYGFDIEFLYQNVKTASFGTNAAETAYIVFGIFLIVLAILLIAFYGLAGITGAVTLMGSVLMTLFLAFSLGFEFSVATLSACAVIVGLSLLITVNYFERVKSEMRKGRDVEKANREGYHKSYLVSLDASAVALFASVFCFLICTGAFKTFFGVIMVGTIFTWLITNYVDKWMVYWLVKGQSDNNLPYFSFRKMRPEQKSKEIVSTDKKHFSRKTMIILPIIATVLLAVGLPVGYALNGNEHSFFNNSGDFANTYTLNITFRDNNQSYEPLSTAENYIQYIVDMGNDTQASIGTYKAYDKDEEVTDTSGAYFIYDSNKANVNVVEKKDEEDNTYFMIYFSLNVDRDLNEATDKDGKDIINMIKEKMEISIPSDALNMSISPLEDSHYAEDSLVVNSYLTKPTNVTHTSNYLFLVAYLLSVFTWIYIFLRYGLNISLASLASGTLLATFGFGLMSITRIPYNSYTPFAILIALLVLNLLLIPVLARNKETLKERGIRKTATPEERAEIANESAQRSLWITVPVLGFMIIYAIALGILNTQLFGLSIATIVFILLDYVILYFFAVPFYYFLATHVTFKRLKAAHEKHKAKRAAKRKVKKEEEKRVAGPDGIVYVDNGPHETIIPGLNDFRNRS